MYAPIRSGLLGLVLVVTAQLAPLGQPEAVGQTEATPTIPPAPGFPLTRSTTRPPMFQRHPASFCAASS